MQIKSRKAEKNWVAIPFHEIKFIYKVTNHESQSAKDQDKNTATTKCAWKYSFQLHTKDRIYDFFTKNEEE